MVREEQEERLVPVELNELQRLVGEALDLLVAVGPAAGAGDVEALLVRAEQLPPAQVPLAEASRDVAGRLERLGDGRLLQGELVVDLGDAELRPRPPVAGDEVRHADAGGVLARQDARPCRRADGAGGVGVGEPHALPGEPVDDRREVVRAAVAAQVRPAHVVDQDEDEVELPVAPRRTRRRRAAKHRGRPHQRQPSRPQELASRCVSHRRLPVTRARVILSELPRRLNTLRGVGARSPAVATAGSLGPGPRETPFSVPRGGLYSELPVSIQEMRP